MQDKLPENEIVRVLREAAARAPEAPDVHFNLGNALAGRGELDQARACYEKVLALQPNHVAAHCNLGNVLKALGRLGEALASYDHALGIDPNSAEAHFNRGNTLKDMKRLEEAVASYDAAIAIRPDLAAAHSNRGIALLSLNRSEEALASHERAIRLSPEHGPAHSNRGNALSALGRLDEALASYDRALAIKPDFAEALYNRGDALLKLKRAEEAARAFARLLELAPDVPFAKGRLLHSKMLCCDWEGLTGLAETIENDIRAGRKSAEPFGHLAISRSAPALRRCAEIYAAEKYPPANIRLWNGECYRNDRIRLGYVSGQFYAHALSILMAELLERHDRDRFELFAFDNSRDDASGIRGRIKRAFDEMVDISRLGDWQVAAAIRQRKIDILVNVDGYTAGASPGIFSFRPCPVQVNYLGFPGTIGASYVDYIIADRQVIPPSEEACYTEKIVYLPDSYQVNDSKRRIGERAPSRAEAGLPDNGFVFCCFNRNYKITPDIFGVWMRLLSKVTGSVLWLLEDNAAASRNLRREARSRGVEPGRLIFAPRMKLAEHLARHTLANLFLDTLPYNAHTTGSDALWAGLPLITCQGTTFPGRVSSSLLNAVGLPELITRSLGEYEARALELAGDPGALAEIRAKLVRNRATCPLFDTDRFRRHIEAAYVTMWQRTERGERPTSFAVPEVR
jgi:predicted O-linked N-acetylglucosamine transferase (SPINDLY family)